MVTAITQGLAATTRLPSSTSLAPTTTAPDITTTMTVAATTTIGATVAATTTIGATVAATTKIGATVIYPSATTTGTASQPGMVGSSATTIDNRVAGGLFAVATLRQICSRRRGVTWPVPAHSGHTLRGNGKRLGTSPLP